MIQLSSPGRMWLAAITAGILAVAIGLAGASAAVIESTTFEQTVSGGTVPLPGGGALFFFPWHGPRSTFTVSLLDALPTGTPPPRTQLIYEIRATLSGEPVTSFSSLVTLQGPSGTQSELFLFDERTGELQSQGTCFRGGCNISQPGIMVLAAVLPPTSSPTATPTSTVTPTPSTTPTPSRTPTVTPTYSATQEGTPRRSVYLPFTARTKSAGW
jgi:hypothetical protein